MMLDNTSMRRTNTLSSMKSAIWTNEFANGSHVTVLLTLSKSLAGISDSV